ncbi:MAG: type VII secretion AAA-ATPase EccA, partial [Mycolicibacterium sp.]|nr:type VII secretion AAA-ATPase EccA [Mycolicibacterium sp.]
SCAALGAEVYGRRRAADKPAARTGFERLVATYPDQCDAWRGLAAAGEATREVIEHAYRTIQTCGELMSASDVDADGLNFTFDTGLYVALVAAGADGVRLACAAARAADGDFAAGRDIIDDRLLSAQPLLAGWMRAVIYFRSRRWHDVRRVLAPLTTLPHDDEFLRQAVAVAYGSASANLGMWEQGFELLADQGVGPIPTANAEALLTAGLCARALDRPDAATALLNEAYAVGDVADSVRARIAEALHDPEFGILPTTPTRIDARSDYWDAATEPGEREYARQLGAQRRAQLNAEAEKELAEFVGMADVKASIARLESSVLATKKRERLGLPVRNKTLHLVLKGPPGVGKTSIARVLAKKLCAAEVLPADTFIEAGRGDLVDKVIGGSEFKILAILKRIIDSGGGALFIDEAYALTDSGSENDFGPLVLAELMRYMVDHADKLMVIVAGYADKMDEFLDSNEGLRSRFGREIMLPSYSVDELLEITDRMATKGGSIVEDQAPLREVYTRLAHATVVDTTGRRRSALDEAGNGRFAAMLIEFAEEERDHRLDVAGQLETASPEQLQILTDQDMRAAAHRLLEQQHERVRGGTKIKGAAFERGGAR